MMTMKTLSKDNILYGLIQGFYWMTYCTVCGFVSSYLRDIGFQDKYIGIAVAIAGLCSSLLQPVLAKRVDTSGRRLLKPCIYLCLVLSVAMSVLQIALPDHMRAALGFLFVLDVIIMQVLLPLINSLSVNARREINFGFGRSFGSLGYALIALVVGGYLESLGMDLLAWTRFLCIAGMVIGVYCLQIRYSEVPQIGQEKTENKGFFERNTGFPAIMAGCFLIYFCHVLMAYFNYQIVLSKGGDNGSLGIMLFIAAVVEIPVMCGYKYLKKLAPDSFWFVFSGIGFAIKAFAFLTAPNLPVFYLIQATQMLGWALLCVASVDYVKQVTLDEDSTRGQAYITLTYTAAMVVGSVLGGYMIQYKGVDFTMIAAVATALIGTLVLWGGIRVTGGSGR